MAKLEGTWAEKVIEILERGTYPNLGLASDRPDGATILPALLSGAEIVEGPRYIVGRKELGHGFQGAVFPATDTRLGISVAIKFRLSDPTIDHQKFRREARLAARASAHANVVSVYDFGEWTSGDTHVVYIVSALMTGGSLFDLVENSQTRGRTSDDLASRLELIGDAVNGLAHMHGVELVHRDIKPQNLLKGPDGIVRLADFGFAKNLAHSTTVHSGKNDGKSVPDDNTYLEVPGTPGYQAPELIRGGMMLDKGGEKAIDVFAMGITAYEIIFGQSPFVLRKTNGGAEGIKIGTALSLWSKQVEDVVPNDFGEELVVPQPIRDLLKRMVAYNPASRPLIDHVQRVFENEVLKAKLQTSDAFEWIRNSIINKMQAICAVFASTKSPVVPLGTGKGGEDKNWYMTVLVRPMNRMPIDGANPEPSSGKEVMADMLYPVYLPHYEHRQPKHWCDWLDRNSNQPFTPLKVRECRSGLVIDYYDDDMRDTWVEQGYIDNDHVNFYTGSGTLHRPVPEFFIRYLCLSGIRDARFPQKGGTPSGATLIQQRYRTDLDLGFSLTDGKGGKHRMRDDIQTEIVVPIYAPGALSQKERLGPDDVVGVVNVEWVHALDDNRVGLVGDRISEWVNVQHLFPVSSLLAELVDLVTGDGPQHNVGKEDREHSRLLG